jgi:hypothetical protein
VAPRPPRWRRGRTEPQQRRWCEATPLDSRPTPIPSVTLLSRPDDPLHPCGSTHSSHTSQVGARPGPLALRSGAGVGLARAGRAPPRPSLRSGSLARPTRLPGERSVRVNEHRTGHLAAQDAASELACPSGPLTRVSRGSDVSGTSGRGSAPDRTHPDCEPRGTELRPHTWPAPRHRLRGGRQRRLT